MVNYCSSQINTTQIASPDQLSYCALIYAKYGKCSHESRVAFVWVPLLFFLFIYLARLRYIYVFYPEYYSKFDPLNPDSSADSVIDSNGNSSPAPPPNETIPVDLPPSSSPLPPPTPSSLEIKLDQPRTSSTSSVKSPKSPKALRRKEKKSEWTAYKQERIQDLLHGKKLYYGPDNPDLAINTGKESFFNKAIEDYTFLGCFKIEKYMPQDY